MLKYRAVPDLIIYLYRILEWAEIRSESLDIRSSLKTPSRQSFISVSSKIFVTGFKLAIIHLVRIKIIF